MFMRASILVVSLNLGEENGTSEMRVSHCLGVDALLVGRSLGASNLSIFAIARLVRVQMNARHVPFVPVDGARDAHLRPDLRPTHHRIRPIKYISIFHRYSRQWLNARRLCPLVSIFQSSVVCIYLEVY